MDPADTGIDRKKSPGSFANVFNMPRLFKKTKNVKGRGKNDLSNRYRQY